MKKTSLILLSVFLLFLSIASETFAGSWSYNMSGHDGSPAITTSYKKLTIKVNNTKGKTTVSVQKLSGGKWVTLPDVGSPFSGGTSYSHVLGTKYCVNTTSWTFNVDSKHTKYRVLAKHSQFPKSSSAGTVTYYGHS